MKNELIAVPVFQDRVSPLIDVSNSYIIYETENGEVKQKIYISLNNEGEHQRVEKLKEIGVNTIICGAVSGFMADLIVKKGMRILPMVYGPINDVVDQYLDDSLDTPVGGPPVCKKGCMGRDKRHRSNGPGARGHQNNAEGRE